MKKKRVLVTGEDGLVGYAIKSISKEYSNLEFSFINRKCANLTKENDVENVFANKRPDYVVNCAARVGGIKRNLEQPVEQFEQNILMNTHVVRNCHKYNVEKLITFSSICVLPPDQLPLKEDNIHHSAPYYGHWFYAHAKRMLDVQIEAYRKQYNRNYCSLLPGSLFGSNDNYNLDSGHVIPSLIHKCFLAKKNNVAFSVWGDGSAYREFLYSIDLARITLELLNNVDVLPQNLLVSSDVEYSIKQVVDKVCEFFDYNNVSWETDKPNGQLHRTSDLRNLRTILPDFSFTSFDESLKKSIDWFIEHYPNCRI